jgi:hypothetical protein
MIAFLMRKVIRLVGINEMGFGSSRDNDYATVANRSKNDNGTIVADAGKGPAVVMVQAFLPPLHGRPGEIVAYTLRYRRHCRHSEATTIRILDGSQCAMR